MKIQITKNSAKNLSIQVSGVLQEDLPPTVILDLDSLSAPPREGWKGVRLDSAVWALQEKMGICLSWEEDGGDNLLLVCESRNSMRFEDGVHSPRVSSGWRKKLYMSTFGVSSPKGFFFILDFDKQ